MEPVPACCRAALQVFTPALPPQATLSAYLYPHPVFGVWGKVAAPL